MDSSYSGEPSASGRKVITRKYIFEQIQEQNLPTLNEKCDNYEKYLVRSYGTTEDLQKYLKHEFSHVKSQIKQRWLKAGKNMANFLKYNESWLEGSFEIPVPHSQGRPCKPFEELSERSKRMKTEEVRASLPDEIIVHAAQSVLQTSGKRDASKVLKDITNSRKCASNYKRSSNANETIAPLTPQEALQMYVDADLTRHQYEVIRSTNKKHFPCYDLLLKAKQECYTPKESLRVTATCAASRCALLLTSDPLISSMRQKKKSPCKAFLPETIDLLLPAEPYLPEHETSVENKAVNAV